jgi:hypothetical protein
MELSLQTTPKSKNYFYDLAHWERRRTRLWVANNTVINLTGKIPAEWGWSWESIVGVYAALGKVFQSYDEINKRINVPKPDIGFKDDENTFIMRFWGDVNRIDAQLQILEAEMNRRKKLIGVFG